MGLTRRCMQRSQVSKRGGVCSGQEQKNMSKARKQQFGLSSGEAPSKSEYDDEELKVVTGRKIEVKSEKGGAGAGNGAAKTYNFTGVTPGSEF